MVPVPAQTMVDVEAQHIAAGTAAAVRLAMSGSLTVNSTQGGAMDHAHGTYRHGVSLSGDTADSGSGSVSDVQARIAAQISQVFGKKPGRFAVRNARKIDARGIRENFWLISEDGVIAAAGTRSGDFEAALRRFSAENADGADSGMAVIDAAGSTLTPGYIDIHAHGAWAYAYDDGAEAISLARAGHMVHGTTRQVLSLITNPIDVMCRNVAAVRQVMADRPDILGAHLEGPFLALARKGAHDPQCLKDPVPQLVDRLLQSADGCIRQITIAPELPHGISAVRQFAGAGVIPAVGHCDADYETAQQAFDAGAGIMTHIFNAMNGIHHRDPGPILAAVEDPRITIEMINDGFHVQDPVIKLAFAMIPHRIALITDAMAATGCPDGAYKLGSLDVNVVDGHARLVSNGAIAGSTLLLETAVQRAVIEQGVAPADAVEAATLTPAKAFGFDRPNDVTGAPLGLAAPGYAADILLSSRDTWEVQSVWCAGRPMPASGL